jgi:microcompartment protein CcmK/EutM
VARGVVRARGWWCAVGVALAGAVSAPANARSAGGGKAACLTALQHGDKAREEGSLREAYDFYSRCARKTCGRDLYNKCGARWVTAGKTLQARGTTRPGASPARDSSPDVFELPAATAAAAPPRGGAPTCGNALEAATRAEAEDHLREAQALLATCTRKACGAGVYARCTSRRAALAREMPTVMMSAVDERGNPVDDVEVTIDGSPLASHLGDRPVAIDPGTHQLTFKTPGGAGASEKVVVARGERSRKVAVALRAGKPTLLAEDDPLAAPLPGPEAPSPAVAEAPPPPAREVLDSEDPPRQAKASERRSGGPGPYLLGGLGLVGLGGYAVLTHWGRTDNDNLGQCSPRCPLMTVHHIRQLYLAADISAAAGAVALITATTWLILRSGGRAEERAGRGPRYAVDLRPTTAGALATVRGAF